MSSTSSKPQLDAQKLRERFTRFRILVIGRANAGKTTILRKLCNATEEPMIFDPTGNKIESSTLDPSLKRGEHDIQNEIVFKTSPGFIFHDSRGFEAGDDWELNLVQEFIAQRSKAKNVKQQLHAIWYCIPTSDDRPITAAERKFFNEYGTGLVPVILLWTKTDALDIDKIMQLVSEGNSLAQAEEQAPEKAWADFEKENYPIFNRFKYPPKAYVVFRNMHESGGDCNNLIQKTAAALSSEELQQLFLSTQQNHVEICLKYGIEKIVFLTDFELSTYFTTAKGNWTCFIAIVLIYFPNARIYFDEGYYDKKFLDEFGDDFKKDDDFKGRKSYNLTSLSKTMSPILSGVGLSTIFNLKGAIYCAIVTAIIAHLHFLLMKESSSYVNKPTLEEAVQIYLESTSHNAVNLETVGNLFQASSVDDTFLKVFKHSHVDKKLLCQGAVKIASDNLLRKY